MWRQALSIFTSLASSLVANISMPQILDEAVFSSLIMSDSYQYSPLPPGQHIRILRLHPAKTGPLKCDLIMIDLDDKGRLKYEALSYVWGSNTPECYNSCIGLSSPGKISITENCESALLYLRHKRKHRMR